MKCWFAADVQVSKAAVEAVESALLEFGALGTEIDLLGSRDAESVVVSGYFDSEPDTAALREGIENEFVIYGIEDQVVESIEIRTVEERDWLAEWKRHWQPVRAGRFVIAPTWWEGPELGEFNIRIDPGRAFGTGTHDTTKLCLEAIGEHVSEGNSFLDVGTGTGILAIAAAKLGASTITACDTDEDSVAIARANFELNGLVEKIDLFQGSITDASPCSDVVAANLTLDVILPILPLLLNAADRVLILSGILAEQGPDIELALKKQCVDNFVMSRSGEWISLVIAKV
jgi:ribosomal protein L11 methyltransferase